MDQPKDAAIGEEPNRDSALAHQSLEALRGTADAVGGSGRPIQRLAGEIRLSEQKQDRIIVAGLQRQAWRQKLAAFDLEAQGIGNLLAL